MKITAINGRFLRPIYLPADIFYIRDELDKLRADENTQLKIIINSCAEVEELAGKEFDSDLYKMNFLADRINQMDLRSPSKHSIQMAALLKANPERTVDELIRITFSDSVSIYPCKGYSELGEVVIDNEFLPELKDLPNNVLSLLDRKRIGKIFAEQENGVFVGEYYCLPSEYVEPQINITFDRSNNKFFSLMLVPPGKDPEVFGQRFEFPCSKEALDSFASDCGFPIEKLNYFGLNSSLPLMYEPTNVIELNDLAKQLSEIQHDDFVKLKAVMQIMPTMNIRQTAELLTHLDEYELDRQVGTSDDYGRKYLEKFMPSEFSQRVFEDIYFTEIGDEILLFKEGQITTYGALSGRGQQLYTVIQDGIMDQSEEEAEDECEDMEMGVIS